LHSFFVHDDLYIDFRSLRLTILMTEWDFLFGFLLWGFYMMKHSYVVRGIRTKILYEQLR
jgi:hypothetical protein